MSFHRGGAYAVNMGLDPDNVLRIGGWSAGANRWQLDMAGNQTVAGSMTAGDHIRVGTYYSNIFMNDNDESTGGAKSLHANSNLIGFVHG